MNLARKLLVLLLLINSSSVMSQDSKETNESVAAKAQQLQIEYQLSTAQAATDSVKRHASFDRKLHEYSLFELQHRKDTFKLQYYQTIVIFIIVVILVLGGFYMAYLQFIIDSKRSNQLASGEDATEKNKTEKDGEVAESVRNSNDDKAAAEQTSIEISTSGIKLQSSVIGLIILAMSFAFFYLYIKDVYKITELPSSNIKTEQVEKNN